jgi:tetratricopeptide (TPR) repeat protein
MYQKPKNSKNKHTASSNRGTPPPATVGTLRVGEPLETDTELAEIQAVGSHYLEIEDVVVTPSHTPVINNLALDELNSAMEATRITAKKAGEEKARRQKTDTIASSRGNSSPLPATGKGKTPIEGSRINAPLLVPNTLQQQHANSHIPSSIEAKQKQLLDTVFPQMIPEQGEAQLAKERLADLQLCLNLYTLLEKSQEIWANLPKIARNASAISYNYSTDQSIRNLYGTVFGIFNTRKDQPERICFHELSIIGTLIQNKNITQETLRPYHTLISADFDLLKNKLANLLHQESENLRQTDSTLYEKVVNVLQGQVYDPSYDSQQILTFKRIVRYHFDLYLLEEIQKETTAHAHLQALDLTKRQDRYVMGRILTRIGEWAHQDQLSREYTYQNTYVKPVLAPILLSEFYNKFKNLRDASVHQSRDVMILGISKEQQQLCKDSFLNCLPAMAEVATILKTAIQNDKVKEEYIKVARNKPQVLTIPSLEPYLNSLKTHLSTLTNIFKNESKIYAKSVNEPLQPNSQKTPYILRILQQIQAEKTYLQDLLKDLPRNHPHRHLIIGHSEAILGQLFRELEAGKSQKKERNIGSLTLHEMSVTTKSHRRLLDHLQPEGFHDGHIDQIRDDVLVADGVISPLLKSVLLTVDDDTAAYVHYQLGSNFFRLGYYEEASEALEEALKGPFPPTLSVRLLDGGLGIDWDWIESPNAPEQAVDLLPLITNSDLSTFELATLFLLQQAYTLAGKQDYLVENLNQFLPRLKLLSGFKMAMGYTLLLPKARKTFTIDDAEMIAEFFSVDQPGLRLNAQKQQTATLLKAKIYNAIKDHTFFFASANAFAATQLCIAHLTGLKAYQGGDITTAVTAFRSGMHYSSDWNANFAISIAQTIGKEHPEDAINLLNHTLSDTRSFLFKLNLLNAICFHKMRDNTHIPAWDITAEIIQITDLMTEYRPTIIAMENDRYWLREMNLLVIRVTNMVKKGDLNPEALLELVDQGNSILNKLCGTASRQFPETNVFKRTAILACEILFTQMPDTKVLGKFKLQLRVHQQQAGSCLLDYNNQLAVAHIAFLHEATSITAPIQHQLAVECIDLVQNTVAPLHMSILQGMKHFFNGQIHYNPDTLSQATKSFQAAIDHWAPLLADKPPISTEVSLYYALFSCYLLLGDCQCNKALVKNSLDMLAAIKKEVPGHRGTNLREGIKALHDLSMVEKSLITAYQRVRDNKSNILHVVLENGANTQTFKRYVQYYFDKEAVPISEAEGYYLLPLSLKIVKELSALMPPKTIEGSYPSSSNASLPGNRPLASTTNLIRQEEQKKSI